MKKLLLIIYLLSFNSFSQEIVGLWEVTNVNVGNEIMTPVAKWMRFNEDSTFQSGNGWLQNSEGTWTFNKEKMTFKTNAKNGLIDPFEPFNLSWEDSKMIWSRVEDGMKVTVTLKKIKKLPKAIGDELVGLWDLSIVLSEGKEIQNQLDPNDKNYVFIRWDRIYVERTAESKRTTGYWHIHGHKPEITFLSHQQGNNPETWQVNVNESSSELTLKGLSESNHNLIKTYRRLTDFPE